MSGALGRFTQGEIDADQLVAFLSAMGVELRGRCAGCSGGARRLLEAAGCRCILLASAWLRCRRRARVPPALLAPFSLAPPTRRPPAAPARRKEDLASLPDQLNSARSTEERLK